MLSIFGLEGQALGSDNPDAHWLCAPGQATAFCKVHFSSGRRQEEPPTSGGSRDSCVDPSRDLKGGNQNPTKVLAWGHQGPWRGGLSLGLLCPCPATPLHTAFTLLPRWWPVR